MDRKNEPSAIQSALGSFVLDYANLLLWGFVEYGNRKALRLRAQGVYSCK